MQGKYRDAQSHAEIKSIITQSYSSDCIIWQNILGERHIYKVATLKISDSGTELILQIIGNVDLVDLDESLYFKLQYRETMFKTEVIKCQGSEFVIALPKGEQVKTIELRRSPRIQLSLDEDSIVSLAISHLDSVKEKEVLRFQVVDISDSGICLLVSKENKAFFQECEKIVLLQLGSAWMEDEIELTEKYALDFRFKKRGKHTFSNRIGLKFSKRLTLDEIKNFVEKSW